MRVKHQIFGATSISLGLTSKANALKDVAFGKQLTVRLLNDEYEKWEAFNEAKNVSRVTKVKDLENKQRIHDNIEKMLGVEREEFRDQAHLNESLQFHVSAISEALQALMIAKESKNGNPKSGTTSGGATKTKNKKRGVKPKRRTRPRPRRPRSGADPKKENKDEKKRKRQGKSGETPNGKRRGRKNGGK